MCANLLWLKVDYKVLRSKFNFEIDETLFHSNAFSLAKTLNDRHKFLTGCISVGQVPSTKHLFQTSIIVFHFLKNVFFKVIDLDVFIPFYITFKCFPL